MHECTSIIINSFHLFQETKGFRVTHHSRRGGGGGGGGGGRGGTPPSNNFFQTSPIKTDAPHGALPQFKNEAPPSEKQSPHWNMKYPSMNWFLEKAQ